jgi:hypothetical protein
VCSDYNGGTYKTEQNYGDTHQDNIDLVLSRDIAYVGATEAASSVKRCAKI